MSGDISKLVYASKYIFCSTCNGTGIVYVYSATDLICLSCFGRGVVFMSDGKKCNKCGGKGKTSGMVKYEQQCGSCHGLKLRYY